MLLVLAVASGTSAAPTRTGLQANVTFDAMPAFARNGKLWRRLQSPLGALRTRWALAGNPGALQASQLDPIGTAAVPLPPAKLLHQFQDASRLVFLTGDDDMLRQAQLARASASLLHWCAFNTHSITLLHTPHVLADAAAVGRALRWLQQPTTPLAERVSVCRAKIHAKLDTQLTQARALVAAGQTNESARALEQIDSDYGGLAAPASVNIMRAIEDKRLAASNPSGSSAP